MNKAYILLCFFIFYSCSWGTHDTPASLRPYSNASLICNIAPASNSYEFHFYSSADWEAFIDCQQGEEEMLERPSVYPQSGLGSSSLQSVNFTVPENNTDQTLTYYLTIVSGERSLVVTIRQRSVLGILNVDPAEFLFPALGGSVNVDVESNADWTTRVEVDWVTVTPDSGRGYEDAFVSLTAPHNRTGYRTSSVLFLADTMTRVVNVSQHAFHVSLPLEQTVSFDGPHTVGFSVLSSLPWEISSDAAWCSVQTVAHDESDTAVDNQISIEANPGVRRTARLTVKNTHDERLNYSITQNSDLRAFYDTDWSGTATLTAAFITRTGSMNMTIVDDENVIVRGYPGQILEFTDETIRFQVFLDEISYEGYTGYDVTAVFTGTFSADQSRISGTLSGRGTLMGITLNVSGTWELSR